MICNKNIHVPSVLKPNMVKLEFIQSWTLFTILVKFLWYHQYRPGIGQSDQMQLSFSYAFGFTEVSNYSLISGPIFKFNKIFSQLYTLQLQVYASVWMLWGFLVSCSVLRISYLACLTPFQTVLSSGPTSWSSCFCDDSPWMMWDFRFWNLVREMAADIWGSSNWGLVT